MKCWYEDSKRNLYTQTCWEWHSDAKLSEDDNNCLKRQKWTFKKSGRDEDSTTGAAAVYCQPECE